VRLVSAAGLQRQARIAAAKRGVVSRLSLLLALAVQFSWWQAVGPSFASDFARQDPRGELVRMW